jgi:prevent-host-death family protein
MRTVSLMTANQQLSRLAREVERGQRFVITRRGRPIAELVPYSPDRTKAPEWVAAYDRMMARLEEGVSLGGLEVDREEIHDRNGR